MEAGPGLGVGLGWQLDGHGAELVVEAEEAPLVAGLGTGLRPALPFERASSASWRTEHVRACSRRSWSVSGVAVSATARTLSRERSPSHRPGDEVRDVPCLLAQVRVGTCSRCRDAEALHGPCLRGRRPVLSIRLAAFDLAEQHDDGPLDGCLLAEQPVETVRDLLVGQGRCRTDHVSGSGSGMSVAVSVAVSPAGITLRTVPPDTEMSRAI